ncbi:MAG: SDR family oxidoreductase [Fimbriimonadaceae bacterium]|nr:SDR family oxidoreductase [Fimbriimonadaceae bacterium]
MTRGLLDLSDRHILVVGGSRGIGAAAARMAARAGAAVSLTYRADGSAADALVAEIVGHGGRAAAFQAEVAEEGPIDAAVDDAVRTLGPLRGVVVSAGIFEGSYLEDMTPEFWDRTMAVNVRGTFLAVRAAARAMRAAAEGGSIVIITSTAGQRGSAEYSAYATSKGAQLLFMRSMAKELAPDGIRVNCVAPAWTETDLAAPSLDALGREEVAAGFPLGRIGLPEDVAGATTFLLSDLAGFITGSTITVDGGMDMRG